MSTEYQESAREFEPKWRRLWAERDVYRTPNPGDADFHGERPKFVVLDFFPYPSGIGLHIGHPLGYIATDALARFRRMTGDNVLHAMGFDAFGLPAEQYALQTGQHPRVTTQANIENMSAQLSLLGLGHDPHRTFSTADPRYYRWTQWLFLVFYGSYYDPYVEWTGPEGRSVIGRARPVEELRDRLRRGEWVALPGGEVGPRSQFPDGKVLSGDNQIERAVDEARLAYITEMPVNWCPELGTVLSNEEVTADGRSERGNFPVYRRSLRQWVMRITRYAPRLLNDLDGIDWPAGIKQMQRDWIGPSSGLDLDFSVPAPEGDRYQIRVFTTRPDTLLGVTFLVLSPDHPLVGVVVSPERSAEVRAYCQASNMPGRAARGEHGISKDGVFTGSYALHPVTGERLPIWLASYVLMEYGTGAVMGVPAHDERDLAFAEQYGLPVRTVVKPDDEWLRAAGAPGENAAARLAAYAADPAAVGVFTGYGTAWSPSVPPSGLSLDGLPSEEAAHEVLAWATRRDLGNARVRYRLRDWLFSRQRYWGEPFPVVQDVATGRMYPLDEAELPLTLPELTDFRPTTGQRSDSTPMPPLARATDWIEVDGWITADGRARTVAASGQPVAGVPIRRLRRDANTMPNWAGSCWYYLRYFDPHNSTAFVGAAAERYWSTGGHPDPSQPGAVDLYMGGAEHAVLHLLYARFWHKMLYDRGLVSTSEPFQRLFNQGMITADAFHDERGAYVDFREVDVRHDGSRRVAYRRSDGHPLQIETGKMGKRYKNGIPPEEVAEQYTMDTLRVYEMFMGPLDSSKPWQPNDIVGSFRFLRNVWRLGTDRDRWPLADAPGLDAERIRHRTVKRVTDDIANLRMNKAVSELMKWSNSLQKEPALSLEHLRTLALLVSPFAPYLGEELAARLFGEEYDRAGSVIAMQWPDFDPELTIEESVQVPVQVNKKTRAVIDVDAAIDEQSLIRMAMDAVAAQLAGQDVVRTIVKTDPIPEIVSFVIRPSAASSG